MNRNETIASVVKNYKVAMKKEGEFIFGNDIPHGKVMRQLGFVDDVNRVGGKAVRGFWVHRRQDEPSDEEIANTIRRFANYELTDNKTLRLIRNEVPFSKLRRERITILMLNDIEKEIMAEIQPEDHFKGMLIYTADVAAFFKERNINHQRMESILGGLGFKFYKNGHTKGIWIKNNPNFKDRIIFPPNYMQERIAEQREYNNREYILCPNCRGLCTREIKCYKCYGQKIIKASEL